MLEFKQFFFLKNYFQANFKHLRYTIVLRFQSRNNGFNKLFLLIIKQLHNGMFSLYERIVRITLTFENINTL